MTENQQLIEKAKAELISKPKATKSNTKIVETDDPNLINELLAEYSALDEQAKKITAEKDKIKAVIKDVIADNDELHVHGAKVASIARWRETTLVTEAVKTTFPVKEYPELYKRANRSRLTIH